MISLPHLSIRYVIYDLQIYPQVVTSTVRVRAIPAPRLQHHIRHPTTTPEPDPNAQLLFITPYQP